MTTVAKWLDDLETAGFQRCKTGPQHFYFTEEYEKNNKFTIGIVLKQNRDNTVMVVIDAGICGVICNSDATYDALFRILKKCRDLFTPDNGKRNSTLSKALSDKITIYDMVCKVDHLSKDEKEKIHDEYQPIITEIIESLQKQLPIECDCVAVYKQIEDEHKTFLENKKTYRMVKEEVETKTMNLDERIFNTDTEEIKTVKVLKEAFQQEIKKRLNAAAEGKKSKDSMEFYATEIMTFIRSEINKYALNLKPGTETLNEAANIYIISYMDELIHYAKIGIKNVFNITNTYVRCISELNKNKRKEAVAQYNAYAICDINYIITKFIEKIEFVKKKVDDHINRSTSALKLQTK